SHLANFTISGGWISFSSIMLRFVLTVSSVLALIAVTGFSPVCSALLRLGTPKIFVVQLMLMHRYLFVLLDEASKMVGAKSLRTFENSTGGLRIYGAFTGSLLLRTMERAERIYSAMQCRGFDGDIKRTLPAEFGKRDILFLCGWSLLFLLLRAFNLPLIIGQILTGTM
ncbi:MAG TPA: energy-coupling factor transporter transmembrane component T, partial [Oligoflexia bacterium]|nr:energy-coupling factor transporter transmembrane component T [Oligoflexia bacterium]